MTLVSTVFISRDVTIFNDHITHSGIIDSDFQDEPDPTLWTVLNNGDLLGFSYERDQKVEGWHRHQLGGVDVAVKAVSCIPKPNKDGDDIWLIVQRTINGATVQTVEYITDYFDGANDGKKTVRFSLIVALHMMGIWMLLLHLGPQQGLA